MIVGKRIIEVERRLSDYCKGCNYFCPEVVEMVRSEDWMIKERQIEYCKHGNMCDSLYQRILKGTGDVDG